MKLPLPSGLPLRWAGGTYDAKRSGAIKRGAGVIAGILRRAWKRP
jgi:hypothetical protein